MPSGWVNKTVKFHNLQWRAFVFTLMNGRILYSAEFVYHRRYDFLRFVFPRIVSCFLNVKLRFYEYFHIVHLLKKRSLLAYCLENSTDV